MANLDDLFADFQAAPQASNIDDLMADFPMPNDTGNSPEVNQALGLNQPVQAPGFMDRLNQAFAARRANAETSAQSYFNGQQSLPEAVIQAGTQGLAVAGDVGSEVLGALNDYGKSFGDAVYNVLPKSTQDALGQDPILNGAYSVASAAKDNIISPVANYAAGKLGALAEESPRAARNIAAAGNYANAVLPFVTPPGLTASPAALIGEKALVPAAKAVAMPVTSAAKGAGQVIRGSNFDLNDVKSVAAADKKVSSAAYQAMRDNGAVLNTPAAQGVVTNIANDIKGNVLLNERLHGDSMSVLKDLTDDVANNGQLDLEKLDQYRRSLGGVVKKNKLNNPEDAMVAARAISKLDEAVNNLGQSDLISGTQDAIDALNQGREAYGKSIRTNRIIRLVEDSTTNENGAINTNALQAKIKTFLRNEKKTAGYSPEELAALKNIADEGLGAKSLRILGLSGIDFDNLKGLQSMFGTALGAGGAFTTGGTSLGITAAGTVANKALNLSTKGKLDAAFEALKRKKP